MQSKFWTSFCFCSAPAAFPSRLLSFRSTTEEWKWSLLRWEMKRCSSLQALHHSRQSPGCYRPVSQPAFTSHSAAWSCYQLWKSCLSGVEGSTAVFGVWSFPVLPSWKPAAASTTVTEALGDVSLLSPSGSSLTALQKGCLYLKNLPRLFFPSSLFCEAPPPNKQPWLQWEVSALRSSVCECKPIRGINCCSHCSFRTDSCQTPSAWVLTLPVKITMCFGPVGADQ